MNFAVYSDKTSYQWDDSNLYGELYVKLDGFVFPGDKWADMVCDVLIMWGQNLLSLLESNLTGEEEFFFLEKPFSFTVAARGANSALITLYDDSKPLDYKNYEAPFFTVLYAIFSLIGEISSDQRLQNVQQVKRLKNLSVRLKKSGEELGYHME